MSGPFTEGGATPQWRWEIRESPDGGKGAVVAAGRVKGEHMDWTPDLIAQQIARAWTGPVGGRQLVVWLLDSTGAVRWTHAWDH